MKRFQEVFDNAFVYGFFQALVSRKGTMKFICDEIIKPNGVSSVLDFGCGIGNFSDLFADSEYIGVEPLQSCIKVANARYGGGTTNFILGDESYLPNIETESMDLVIAIGVLHHIDDQVARKFTSESLRILRHGGRLVTFDPVIHIDQTRISRFIVGKDRGLFVRTPEEYLSLFDEMSNANCLTKFSIHSRLLRFPYDQIGIEVFKP